jgi:hypothetical protein
MQLVEKLLEGPEPIIASVIARQRAANRGLDRRAPFHGSKPFGNAHPPCSGSQKHHAPVR